MGGRYARHLTRVWRGYRTKECEEMFNNPFTQSHAKWLKWAIAFHNAEFSLQLTTVKTSFASELYSTTEEQLVK
jgi:hypothetical protein